MENKKKTLVPIIIGVTILVILVAGATYAYFQASNSASGTTNVETSTEKIGTVVVTNPTENLYMKLSAYDMQESKAGTSYYATNDSSKSYETELSNYTISSYSISGGEEDTVYNCTYKLNITKPSQILAGDMSLKLQLNGATINGSNLLDIDLANVSSTYTVTFSATGNTSGTLVTGGIVFNNTSSEQNHLVGQTLSTVITNSDLDCEVAEPTLSICTYDTSSTVAEGLEGAKYNCKVDPNKDEYTFYLIDNNDDGTSDLIMNANINASEEAVIPGVTSDTGIMYWYAQGYSRNGPIDAMTYLHNATKSWTNVEPLNYEYYDREFQGITDTSIGYESFVSINGIATITKGDEAGSQVTIGSVSEPLRARMPIYSATWNDDWTEKTEKGEVSDKTDVNSYLYDNLVSIDEDGYPAGYWTMSSYVDSSRFVWHVSNGGEVCTLEADDGAGYPQGVRPVITVKL